MPVKSILSKAFVVVDKAQEKFLPTRDQDNQSGFSERLIDAAYKLDKRNALATYKKGLKHAERQNWTEALDAFQDTLQSKEPPPPSFYHHYGITLLKVGAEKMARQAFQMSLYYLPDAYWSAYELGIILYKGGQPPEAEKCFRLVLEYAPEHEWATLYLAHCLVGQGINEHWEDAIELYLKFADCQPDNPAAYYSLKNKLLFSKLVDEGYTSRVEQLVEKHPQAYHPKLLLGWLRTEQSRTDQAISLFKHVSVTSIERQSPHLQHLIDPQQKSMSPSFVILGPEKSGTSSLFEWLCQHPQVIPPLQKELRFFDRYFESGFDWYQSQFPPLRQHAEADFTIYGPDNPEFWVNKSDSTLITGEASSTYLSYSHRAEAIKARYPDLKLIVLNRNPVKRAYSYYQMLKRHGYSQASWSETVRQEIEALGGRLPDKQVGFSTTTSSLARSCVLPQIQQWLDVFSADQMLVLNSVEMFGNPQGSMDILTQFLEIDSFKPTTFSNVNPGHYRPMSPKLEQYLTSWFAPHEMALTNFLDEHKLLMAPEKRKEHMSTY